jgi:hypothetical protein
LRFPKRLIKRIAIGFGIVIGLLLVVNGVLAWMAQHRLDRKIAELRAAGEPASLAELAPKPVAAEKNAATYLERACTDLTKFSQDWDKRFDGTALGKQLDELAERDLLPNREQQSAMRPILDAYGTVLPTIENAAKCDQYASRLDFNVPPRQFLDRYLEFVPSLRILARFVRWNMMIATADGKPDSAIRLGVQALRLTRQYDQEPLLISRLVSIAVRRMMFASINTAVRQEGVSEAARMELDSELALHENLTPLMTALRTERAFAIPYSVEQAGAIPAFVRWGVLNWCLGELDAEDVAYRVATLPMDQIRRQWNPIEKRTTWPQLDSIKDRLIMPAIVATFESSFRSVAQARCLRIVNALGEYRQKTGKEAESIEQLSLPHDAIIDPCSGKPLRITKTDAGWIVYSVYRNGDDDGGKFHAEDGAWGFGPPGYENDERR